MEKSAPAQAAAAAPPPPQQPPPVSLSGRNPQERTAPAAAPVSDGDEVPGLVSDDEGGTTPQQQPHARLAPLSLLLQAPPGRDALQRPLRPLPPADASSRLRAGSSAGGDAAGDRDDDDVPGLTSEGEGGVESGDEAYDQESPGAYGGQPGGGYGAPQCPACRKAGCDGRCEAMKAYRNRLEAEAARQAKREQTLREAEAKKARALPQ